MDNILVINSADLRKGGISGLSEEGLIKIMPFIKAIRTLANTVKTNSSRILEITRCLQQSEEHSFKKMGESE